MILRWYALHNFCFCPISTTLSSINWILDLNRHASPNCVRRVTWNHNLLQICAIPTKLLDAKKRNSSRFNLPDWHPQGHLDSNKEPKWNFWRTVSKVQRHRQSFGNVPDARAKFADTGPNPRERHLRETFQQLPRYQLRAVGERRSGSPPVSRSILLSWARLER